LGHAAEAGAELVDWLTGLTAQSKKLADDTAGGLDEQTGKLAAGLAEYAGKVAAARREYAELLATKTATHDKDIAGASAAYKNLQAEKERVRENAEDAAE
jgi:hypothetical protein